MVIFDPVGSETPEPVHLKFGMCDYVHSPTHVPHTVAEHKIITEIG